MTRNTITYTPESVLRHPARLFRAMGRDLVAARYLGWSLLLRDVKAQYRQSFLGYIWAFLPPAITTGLFVFLNETRGMDIGNVEIPYALFVATGLVFWQLFVDCLTTPSKVVEGAKAMITKLDFPREALILTAIGLTLVNFVIRILLLCVFCLFFSYIPSLSGLLMIIPCLIPLLLFGLCLGLLVLPCSILYKDFSQGVMLSMTFLMFVTPVGYAFQAGSDNAAYVTYNPLSYLINYPRDLFLGMSPDYGLTIIGLGLVSVFICIGGWVIFRIALPIIFERLSS